MRFALVIINISADALDRPFTYIVPKKLEDGIQPGTYVKVPFGKANKLKSAVVIGLKTHADFDMERMKTVDSVDNTGAGAQQTLIELAKFMAAEYGCTLNQALKTVLPVRKTVRKNSRRTDPVKVISETGEFIESSVELSPDQERVYEEIIKSKKPSLLYGITGSGKTRIYIELIRSVQKKKKQAILLIPEISLTYQTVRELRLYLGDRVALTHSRLSQGEKYEQYLKASSGQIDVMVGPRSALFAPFPDLGLIIIDEEHEGTYHSDTSPRYDTRQVAARLSELKKAKLVLGSATPSLESYKKALDGIYSLHVLKTRARKGAVLPAIHLVDMRKEFLSGNKSIFSRKLFELTKDRLNKNEQIMLFLNRRGYAGFASCRSCGKVFKCPHCDVSLTVHNSWYHGPESETQKSALLSCHYCGYSAPLPKICPDCGSKYVAPFGLGTQKLESQVKKMFPQARVLRMDADTTKRKGSYERILSSFRDGKADILIGTQMIVKGHDFENVTLVGAVSADLSLYSSFYNASERTYELLTQAAGRSGRSEKGGDVVIQSYAPDHYAIATAATEDYENFYGREYSYRKLLKYPPYMHMLFLRFSSPNEDVANAASIYAAKLSHEAHIPNSQIIGPCNESIYKLNDNFRKILYIKHSSHDIILKLRDDIISAINLKFAKRGLLASADFR